MDLKLISSCILGLSLIGCSEFAQHSEPQKPPQKLPSTEKPPIHHANGVTVTPYQVPEIKRQTVNTPDGSEKPVFRQLIQQAQQALQQKNLAKAEQLALQAQRISPQAAQSYVVLAQVAHAKKDDAHAQSLIQRGLSLANDKTTQQQLWQIRLSIAQTQHDSTAIQRAQQALKAL